MKSSWIIAAIFLPFALSAGEHGKEHGHAFDRIDADHDGVISRAEAANAPHLANSFDVLDTDKNGSLSHDELEQHAQNRQREMHDKMEEKFKSADTNGDGQLSAEEAQGMPRLASDFAAVDKNGDGLVSREELRQRAKVMHKTTMEGHDDRGEHKSGDKPAESKPQ